METLWTINEVAAAAQVAPGTIRKAIRKGELEAVRVGRLIRITNEAFRKYLKPVVAEVER